MLTPNVFVIGVLTLCACSLLAVCVAMQGYLMAHSGICMRDFLLFCIEEQFTCVSKCVNVKLIYKCHRFDIIFVVTLHVIHYAYRPLSTVYLSDKYCLSQTLEDYRDW